MRYCPSCGSEYRAGYEECADCLVPLVDTLPEPTLETKLRPTAEDRPIVFRSGRRMDAELVRARLEADGLQAWIWSSGLGPWRMESALTEVTGVPNDFNSHNVVVSSDDLDRALEVLAELQPEPPADDPDPLVGTTSWMEHLRDRRLLTAFAMVLLFVVVFFGVNQ